MLRSTHSHSCAYVLGSLNRRRELHNTQQNKSLHAAQVGYRFGRSRCRASRTVQQAQIGEALGGGNQDARSSTGYGTTTGTSKKERNRGAMRPVAMPITSRGRPSGFANATYCLKGGAETCCRDALAKLVFRRRFYIGTTRSHRRPGI